jgi:V/A-type H+-transporting ATPase subunit B
VKSSRSLAAVIGEEELSDLDKGYLSFGDRFEREFLAQGERENRSIDQTLDLGWKILTALPRSELYRVQEETLQKYFHPENGARVPGHAGGAIK